MFRITFSKSNVKRFQQELNKAYQRGDKRAICRLSVLLMIGSNVALETILSVWNVSQQTAYNWLNDFLAYQFDRLEYQNAPGRPPRLTKSQKRELAQWIEEGPEACGYPTGCWTSILIQDLIYQKFHVMYSRFYVCELLGNLGFSFQKARFISDHLDEEGISENIEASQTGRRPRVLWR
jgi:transposase